MSLDMSMKISYDFFLLISFEPIILGTQTMTNVFTYCSACASVSVGEGKSLEFTVNLINCCHLLLNFMHATTAYPVCSPSMVLWIIVTASSKFTTGFLPRSSSRCWMLRVLCSLDFSAFLTSHFSTREFWKRDLLVLAQNVVSQKKGRVEISKIITIRRFSFYEFRYSFYLIIKWECLIFDSKV